MLTKEENERLTRVGPGTPAGEMLRRYWWPVALEEDLGRKPVPVRLLGEDLVLFRTGEGRVGLLERACAHRSASLEYGRVEECGLRCCYHGWLYDVEGRCLEQPSEPEGSDFHLRIFQTAYPAQVAGSFVFAYLGPQPVPVLPRYDVFDRTDGTRVVEASVEHCNWLQRAENGMDPGHLPVLHASMYPHLALKRPTYDFQLRPYGARSAMTVEGEAPRVTHFIFPSSSRISTTPRTGYLPSHDLRLRVPTDDTTTTTFAIRFQPRKDGAFEIRSKGWDRSEPGVYERAEDGWWDVPSGIQDNVAQESQGAITDRSREHLGQSDRGIILFRQLLTESIDAVAAGRDPLGVIRDPARARLEFDATMPEAAYAS